MVYRLSTGPKVAGLCDQGLQPLNTLVKIKNSFFKDVYLQYFSTTSGTKLIQALFLKMMQELIKIKNN
jgi:hypothetical protein